MNVFDRGNNDHSEKLHQLIEAGNKQQVFDLVTSLDWLKARQVPSFPYYHHYLNDLRQVQRLFETDVPSDIPQRAALSFAEILVRGVFNDIQDGYRNEELLSFLLLTGHDVDDVIIPFSLIFSKTGRRVKYLRHIGELLLQFSDVDRAQRVFERAVSILCEMSFSEMMEESDGSLWGCERMLVAIGCDLAAFGVLDQRIIDRLAEISQTSTEDTEFEGVLYQGALSIGRSLAASGALDEAIEATELALNNAPHNYQHRMEETRQQVYQELAEALIDSERFDQVEELLRILEHEQIDTTKLWRRYLGILAKASRLEQLQAVVKGLADRHDPHPYAEEILKAESISLRWKDYKAVLESSPEEIRKEQKQAKAYDTFASKLKALRVYYATRFKIYIHQSRFEDARLAIDQMLKLHELSESSGENRYQAVDSWLEELEARTGSAFQLIDLDNEKWSYTPDILPRSYHHSVSDLVHTLLVQGQYDLLERLDNLENPRPWKSTQIQTLLGLKNIHILEDLEEVDFSALYGDEKETRAEAYRYLVFKLTLDGTISEMGQIPDNPDIHKRPLLIAYAQATALDQGLESVFELLKPVLGDSSELDRVRFDLAAPFLWLRDIEQAEKALCQCYEWRDIYVDAGRPLLISLLWRFSTKYTASELATKVKDYIQRGRFEFANAIEFARDMLFIDEHYAREFMLVLLRLWLPAPAFNFVGEKLYRLFRDEQSTQVDLPQEAMSEFETALDTSINPEALDHLIRLGHLSELLIRTLFGYHSLSVLTLVNKGELWIGLGEETAYTSERKPENFVNDLLKLLESLQANSDRENLEEVYESFPIKVFVYALWAFEFPKTNTNLISELEEDIIDILPKMDFDADFRLWVFANCLGILSSERSPQRALEILDSYCEYALQQLGNDDKAQSDAERSRIRLFVLPYVILTAPASEQRERLFSMHLGEIADLNILVQMWAYCDAHNDGQAAEHIMRRMIKLAAETDISLPPSVFPQGSWGGAFGA